MNTIKRLRGLADDIDWHMYDNGGIPRELRSIADEIDTENAKLRELADAVKEFVEDTHCEGCPCRRDCDDNDSIFCANDFSYHAFAAMRELEVEAE